MKPPIAEVLIGREPAQALDDDRLRLGHRHGRLALERLQRRPGVAPPLVR